MVARDDAENDREQRDPFELLAPIARRAPRERERATVKADEDAERISTTKTNARRAETTTEGVKTRADEEIEDVTARVRALEAIAREGFAEMSAALKTLTGQVAALSERVETLSTTSERFEATEEDDGSGSYDDDYEEYYEECPPPPPPRRGDRGPTPRRHGPPPRGGHGPPPHERGPPPHERGPPPHERGPPPHERGPPPHRHPPPHERGTTASRSSATARSSSRIRRAATARFSPRVRCAAAAIRAAATGISSLSDGVPRVHSDRVFAAAAAACERGANIRSGAARAHDRRLRQHGL